MSAPRIYVDVDDVLAETCRALVALLAERFGRRIEFESVHSFDLQVSFGLSPPEYAELMRAAHRPGVLESLVPVEGAVETLAGWQEQGCAIAIVTGRPATSNPSSRRWLGRHGFPYSSFDSLDKYGRHSEREAQGHSLSLRELSGLDFQLAIEDQLDMAGHLAAGRAERVLLLDRPWNRDTRALAPELAERIERVSDWAEVRRRFGSPR